MDVLSNAKHTANKNYRCDYCGSMIEKGFTYCRSTLVDSLGLYTWRAHIECEGLVDELEMDGEDEGLTKNDFCNCIFEEGILEGESVYDAVCRIYENLPVKESLTTGGSER